MTCLTLLTTLSSQDKESILSLAIDKKAGHIFGASQSGDIHVWSLRTFFPVTRLIGHKSSVLCLTISSERSILFSSSGDNTVRIWNTTSFGNAIYIIKPSIDSCGDVLSLTWSDQFNTLYLGCQDTSIQWIQIPQCMTLNKSQFNQNKQDQFSNSPFLHPLSATNSHCIPSPPFINESHSPNSSSTCNRNLHHKFFDSKSQAELLKAARLRDSNSNQASPLLQSTSPEPSDILIKIKDHLEDSSSTDFHSKEDGIEILFINNQDSINYAHFGYIYCLLLISLNDQTWLISGSGDSTIKLWPLDPLTGRIEPNFKLLSSITLSNYLTTNAVVSPESSEDLGAVLTLATHRSTLFTGYQDGLIKIWDLDTFTCIRTLFHPKSLNDLIINNNKNIKDSDDILTITALDNGELFSGSSSGEIIRWDSSFRRILKWESHKGSVLTSCYTTYQGKNFFLTGGSDNCIKVWDVHHNESCSPNLSNQESDINHNDSGKTIAFQDRMFRHLSQFVSFESISNDDHREDCRQAALYLKTTLIKLGAEARLLPGEPGRNPLVLATFKGSCCNLTTTIQENSTTSSKTKGRRRRRRVLYYGHYDVIQTGDIKDWKSPPFIMTGRNGWLYGRGVTDNKGPTLAVAYAVHSLLEQRSLDVDVVMLVEGEEEAGSVGFRKAVLENKELIGEIDVVLISNSYWLDDETPCMTFGLRGVIHANVKIFSSQPDLHSGMHGGAVHEPVLDLVRILGDLIDSNGKIRLNGFYDHVRPLDSEEEKLYDRIVQQVSNVGDLELLKHSPIADVRENLLAKWRHPAMSIHNIDVTGPAHSTVIPSSAQSAVSIRIVPDQSLDQITKSLISFLEFAFKKLNSSNTLEIKINQRSDWWLGHPNDPHSVALAESVEEDWGVKPLWIREGGSIPSVPFLEQEFNAKAIHFPMGCASDSAHLPNERIKMMNLEKGSQVVAKFLKKVALIP